MIGFIMLASGSSLAATVPTFEQVFQAAKAGRLDEARQMMNVVLRTHPNSAKAHYVDAQILAASGQYAESAKELKTAEAIQPELSFASPEAIQKLRAKLSSGLMRVSSGGKAGGFPWGVILLAAGGILLAILIFRTINSRALQNRAMSSYHPANNTPGNYGGPSAPMGPASGGLGSSIGSGLATGLGVGAGIVAGEALAHSLFDHDKTESAAPTPPVDSNPDSWTDPSYDMGGNDFGMNQSDSSWDDDFSGLSDDFSSGGDDWS